MKTFVGKFKKGITCVIHAGDTLPEKGKMHVQKFIWNKKLTPKILRAIFDDYREWIHTVNQQLANEYNGRLMHVFTHTPYDGAQAWCYEPGGKPELLVVTD